MVGVDIEFCQELFCMAYLQIFSENIRIPKNGGIYISRADFRTVCTNRIGTTSPKKFDKTKFWRCCTDTVSTHCSENLRVIYICRKIYFTLMTFATLISGHHDVAFNWYFLTCGHCLS